MRSSWSWIEFNFNFDSMLRALTAWAPKPRSEVQRHLPHCLPTSQWGRRESAEAAEESLWQETCLYRWEIRHHGSQQCHHLEWYSPQDHDGWWTSVVCTLLGLFVSAELITTPIVNIWPYTHLLLSLWSPIAIISDGSSKLVSFYSNMVAC